jgi:hypothetical protein
VAFNIQAVKWKTKECELKEEICKRIKQRKEDETKKGKIVNEGNRKTILEGATEQGRKKENRKEINTNVKGSRIKRKRIEV